jgi:peptidyl-tRNA hydrolase, PTH1 family
MVLHPLQLIVGLGNPGREYSDTRHNAGFWFLDEVARRLGVSLANEAKVLGELGTLRRAPHPLWLLKPTTFMNRSGSAIAALARFYKIPAEAILVAHDELDLAVGDIRLKHGGGHGGHNGLRDTHAQLGNSNYYRLRVGIGHPGDRHQVTGFVLGKPPASEQQLITAAIDRACDHLDELLDGQLARVMNSLNRRLPTESTN